MNVFKGTVSKLVILTASGTKMMTLPSEDVKLYQVRECMILKSKYLSTHTLSLSFACTNIICIAMHTYCIINI